jgi:hypothetical protein
MNEADLFEQLKEIDKANEEVSSLLKDNVSVVNNLICSVYEPGVPGNLFPYFQTNRVFWCYFGESKRVFFFFNNKIYCVNDTDDKSDIFIGIPPNIMHIECATDEIIAEYIRFIHQGKEKILSDINIKISQMKSLPKEYDGFIKSIRTAIDNNSSLEVSD